MTLAPVAGSGWAPAWIARVLKPGLRSADIVLISGLMVVGRNYSKHAAKTREPIWATFNRYC